MRLPKKQYYEAAGSGRHKKDVDLADVFKRKQLFRSITALLSLRFRK